MNSGGGEIRRISLAVWEGFLSIDRRILSGLICSRISGNWPTDRHMSCYHWRGPPFPITQSNWSFLSVVHIKTKQNCPHGAKKHFGDVCDYCLVRLRNFPGSLGESRCTGLGLLFNLWPYAHAPCMRARKIVGQSVDYMSFFSQPEYTEHFLPEYIRWICVIALLFYAEHFMNSHPVNRYCWECVAWAQVARPASFPCYRSIDGGKNHLQHTDMTLKDRCRVNSWVWTFRVMVREWKLVFISMQRLQRQEVLPPISEKKSFKQRLQACLVSYTVISGTRVNNFHRVSVHHLLSWYFDIW